MNLRTLNRDRLAGINSYTERHTFTQNKVQRYEDEIIRHHVVL